MDPLHIFNNAAPPPPRGLYNAAKPFVMVDIGDNDPTRGDVHGYEGLAQRLADKIGADYLLISNETLSLLYPQEHPDTERHHMLSRLFNERGRPDFLFSREMTPMDRISLVMEGAGLHISLMNESLATFIGVKVEPPNPYIVPHHLTQQTMDYEGNRFGQEFQELPRPFIGVMLGDDFTSALDIAAAKLGSLRNVYDGATFFICPSHRTKKEYLNHLFDALRETLGDAKDSFPVIRFDVFEDMNTQGADAVWNPYTGLLAQADHLVVSSSSLSMMSEALAAGRKIYTFNTKDENYFNDLLQHKEGTPLETPAITPPDMTDICVDRLIDIHQDHVLRRPSSMPYRRM